MATKMSGLSQCEHLIIIERLGEQEQCTENGVKTIEFDGTKHYFCEQHWKERVDQLRKDDNLEKNTDASAVSKIELEDVIEDEEKEVLAEEEEIVDSTEVVKIKKYLDESYQPLLDHYSNNAVEEVEEEETVPATISTNEAPEEGESVTTAVTTAAPAIPDPKVTQKKLQLMMGCSVLEKMLGNTSLKVTGLTQALLQDENFNKICEEMVEEKPYTKKKKDIFTIRKHDSPYTKLLKVVGANLVEKVQSNVFTSFMPPGGAQIMSMMGALPAVTASSSETTTKEDMPEYPSARTLKKE